MHWAIFINMLIFWSCICAVSVQSYYSVKVILGVEIVLIISCDIVLLTTG